MEWIRNIHIVTNGQVPNWLNIESANIFVVPHSQLVGEETDFDNVLPTFSSSAIESLLYRIPGLSESHLYIRDNILINRRVTLNEWCEHGLRKIYTTALVPYCQLECPWSKIGDGMCDAECYNEHCQKDGDDCKDRNLKMQKNSVFVHYDYYNPNEYTFEVEKIKLNNTGPKNYHLHEIRTIVEQHNTNYIQKQKQLKRRDPYHITDKDVAEKNKSYSNYVKSLIHTNSVLNIVYGFAKRKIPAQMPFLFEKSILEEYVAKFQNEIGITRRNRFHSGDDFQFLFGYYHFILNEYSNMTLEDIFDMFDRDKTGTWSNLEIKTITSSDTILDRSNSEDKQFEEVLLKLFRTCSLTELTLNSIKSCRNLSEALMSNFGRIRKYPAVFVDAANRITVFDKLLLDEPFDPEMVEFEILQNGESFSTCSNDYVNSTTEESARIYLILKDFYESLYPYPSKWEHGPESINRFSTLEEYRRWRKLKNIFTAVFWTFMILFTLYIIDLTYMYRIRRNFSGSIRLKF